MGERWTEIRDGLGADPGAVIDWLRKQLHALGPFLDPLRTAPSEHRIQGFEDPYDAALVALMQASHLVGRREFVADLLRSGHALAEETNRARRMQHVGQLALSTERLLNELAWRIDPVLHDKGSLADSFKALRRRGVLPLTDDELARWDEDATWVDKESRRGTRIGSRKKQIAILWDRRIEDRLSDPLAEQAYPRYLAFLELSRLRNAFAHGRNTTMHSFTRPDRAWRRITALAAMCCVRAFAQGVLRPAPVREVGAITISHGPAAPSVEPLVAWASIESPAPPRVAREPEPLVAVAQPVRRRRRRRAEAAPPAPSKRGRKWLYITGAATVAVLVGTVGANLLAPQTVVPATASDAPAATPDPAPEPLMPQPSAPPEADEGGLGNLAPPLARLGPSPKEEPEERRGGQTRQCMVARAARGSGPHPRIVVAESARRHPRFSGSHEAGRIGAFLQSNRSLGSVVFLEGGPLGDPDPLLREIEATVCDLRPILRGDDALSGGTPVDEALIVATIDGPDDPRLRSLLALAETGTSPRLLVATPEAPEKRPALSSVLRTQPFDCDRASEALVSLVGGPDARDRVAAWGLFDSPNSAGCTPPPLLQTPYGAGIVAAAIAAHPTPPATLPGPWTSWVGLAVADEEASSGPEVPRAELALRQKALAMAQGTDLDVPKRKRRKLCERWARTHREALGDLDLARHVAGTEPGRACLIHVLDAAADSGSAPDTVAAMLELGLGQGRWRDHAISQAVEDSRDHRPSREGHQVLARLRGAR